MSKEKLQFLGVLMLIGGVVMIVRNKKNARRYEEARKDSRWGHPDDYMVGRILNIIFGSIFAVIGAVLILGYGYVQP